MRRSHRCEQPEEAPCASTPRPRRWSRPRPATSPTTWSANAREPRRRWSSAARRRRAAGTDVTAAQFHDEVRAVAKGLVAAGVERRRPGRADLARPATSGRCSTTRSGSPARSPCPVYETSSAEQVEWILRGLRRARRGRGDARARRPGRRGARRARRAQPRVVARPTTPSSILDPARRGHRRRRARGAPHGRRPRRPGDADLHVGHHRPAQGLHAHPRQLHGRARRGRRGAATSSSTTDGRLARCCSCRWPTSSPGSSRSAA